jgi:cysteine desulfurase
MSESTIYLDYAATSPVDPAVAAAMMGCLGTDGRFANPSSSHAPGVAAQRLVEEARRKIAERVDANPNDIVFTSGATESNNLALQGTFAAGGRGPEGLITTRIEHKSVLDTARVLASKGVQVRFVDTDRRGRVSLEHLERLLSEQPARLVSVMHVNNEIGTVQDITVIARLCNAAGALLHVDAAQSVGKVAVTLRRSGVHLCSLTAHKICGPKGVGALYLSPETRVASLLYGGEQERGLRAGTLPTHQIVGMGAAYAIADPTMDGPRITGLRERFLEGLGSIDGLRINGSPETAIPHIVNLCFPGVEGESLRLALRDLAVSAGSACNSDAPEPSYVLKSLGLSDALASSSLRFSFGRFTTEAEVERAAARVTAEVRRLRALAPSAPSWCSARAF